jgi:peptidoglycan hydrolase CwlO-like protein
MTREHELLEEVLLHLLRIETQMSALSDAVVALQGEQATLDASVTALTAAVAADSGAADAAAAVTALTAVSADLATQAANINAATTTLGGTPPPAPVPPA